MDFHGLVAQLGERCVRNAEVEGSNPFGSTDLKIHLPPNGRILRSFFALSDNILCGQE